MDWVRECRLIFRFWRASSSLQSRSVKILRWRPARRSAGVTYPMAECSRTVLQCLMNRSMSRAASCWQSGQPSLRPSALRLWCQWRAFLYTEDGLVAFFRPSWADAGRRCSCGFQNWSTGESAESLFCNASGSTSAEILRRF